MLRVRDHMHFGLVRCDLDATLGQAAALLVSHQVHALVVADEVGPPLGVLSDLDLLAAVWLSHNPESFEVTRTLTAGQLMSTPVASVDSGASLAEAAARLRSERIHRLVVTEGDHAIGIVSASDFVAALWNPPAGRTVGDVMSRAVVACREDTPVAGAARAMTERRSRSVVVLDRQGGAKGVVTGLDLVGLLEKDAHTTTVSQVMRPPLTTSPTASLREAADKMLAHRVHRLLVVDPAAPDTVPLGLITTTDIVTAMAAPESAWQQEG